MMWLDVHHIVCWATSHKAAVFALAYGLGGAVRFLVVVTIDQEERPILDQLWME